MTSAATESLGYVDPLGHPELRRTLAGYLRRTRGVLAEPEQVVVGAGFAHLLAWWAHVARARGCAPRQQVREAGADDDLLRFGENAAGAAQVPGERPTKLRMTSGST